MTFRHLFFLCLVCSTAFNSATASDLSEGPKLMPSDPIFEGRFGFSIAIDGELAAIGARSTTSPGIGSVYVLEHNNGQWTERQKLVPNDGSTFDNCGFAVDIDGTRVAISCDGQNSNTGAVYLFDFDGNQWSQTQKISGPEARGGGGSAGESFGYSLSLDGDRIAIGAPNQSGNNAPGAVYMYGFDGNNWSQIQKLVANDVSNRNYLGFSVALLADVLVSGAIRDTQFGTSAGAAYVFEFDGINWQQSQKILPQSTDTQSLGTSVGLTSDTLVIGASNDSTVVSAAGAAYVYEQDQLGDWIQIKGLFASDAQVGDRLGRQLSITDGSILLLRFADTFSQNTGAGYLFKKYGNGWTETKIIQPSENVVGDLFAVFGAISNDKILIGAPFDDDGNIVASGSVFTFINDLIFNDSFE